MANNSRIVGVITDISTDGVGPTMAQFFVKYYCNGAPEAGGGFVGSAIFLADMLQNENQLSLDLRGQLAAYVNPLVSPPQNYVTGDVRGCNV